MNAGVFSESNDMMCLPTLREDLEIEKGGSFLNGSPSWLIHDPLRNQFFRVGAETFEILSVWRNVTVPQFCNLASRLLKRNVTRQQVDETAKFLYANQLTYEPATGEYKAYLEQETAKQKSFGAAMLHNYLFFKIPLFDPTKLIDLCWPFVRGLFSRTAVVALAILAFASLYLVSRQWETFTSTFMGFLSFQGAVFYGASLIVLKFLHEFGHAFMARKYNVPVPVIGVAFLVLFPVLFTDTTAAVRLKQRNQRLMIDVAGILTELAVAIIATLFWVFLPDGPLRSIAFTTATLSWALSLLVNLNPFMRFDGYYILSDALGLENLQERSFAFAKWRLREILFKPNVKPPEIVEKKLQTLLIYHAWGTWIYRFFLFLGIAFLVYSFFIKVIGIILFIVEILWFILLPIWRELRIWWQLKSHYKTFRSLVSCSILIALLIVFFVPWSSRIDMPAVLKSSNEFHVFPPINAQLVEANIQEQLQVKKGSVLVRFTSPNLAANMLISEKRTQLLKTRLDRATVSELELSSITVLQQELAAEKQKLQGLKEKFQSLVIRSPFDGKLVNVDRGLNAGNWVSKQQPLSILIAPNFMKLYGYAKAEDMDRLKTGQGGYFIADGFFKKSIPVTLTEIAEISEVELTDSLLTELEGGLIPAVKDNDGTILPRSTWFKVSLKISNQNNDLTMKSITRGVAVIEAEPRSFAYRVFNQIAFVLIRESGF